MGFDNGALARLNGIAVEVVRTVQESFDDGITRIVVSGNIGPRGDGYNPGELMSEIEAEQYHLAQITSLTKAGADMICALTITNAQEAIGIVRAARKNEIPIALAFTVETDGHLPTGQSLKDAIEEVDRATDESPAYYMINCAHPTHFEKIVSTGENWLKRIRGIRANASSMSHAELDNAENLDDGNPAELGAQFHELRATMPNLNVLGGCCGTDYRHIEAICVSCKNMEADVT